MRQEKAIQRENSQVGILKLNGFPAANLHILKPRWLPTQVPPDHANPERRKPRHEKRLGSLETISSFARGERHPSAAITAWEFVTTDTFCRAKLIEALCHSAFIVEQQSSGTKTE